MANWFEEALFYHIYPLGFCGCPELNDHIFSTKLLDLLTVLPPIKSAGFNALLLGPVFRSGSHGYDVESYSEVDERLGDSEVLKDVIYKFKNAGFKIVLDAVFNHTGRDFPYFRDLIQNGDKSQYRDFYIPDFSCQSDLGDLFDYQSWNGHKNLPKLNLKNPQVVQMHLETVTSWISKYDIDGLRLDAADCLDLEFCESLRHHCRCIKSDFYILGEIIGGDYNYWLDHMDSVTNYELYKGLYSSHNDKNMFEIAWTLNRQFGIDFGLYRKRKLYNFADNHDTERLSSILKSPSHQYTANMLLFTVPGIPSVYYGSERGMPGVKRTETDIDLRPSWSAILEKTSENSDLYHCIKDFIAIRRNSDALKYGRYLQLSVDNEHLAFMRYSNENRVVVVINISEKEKELELNIPVPASIATDLLSHTQYNIYAGKCRVKISPNWGRILSLS